MEPPVVPRPPEHPTGHAPLLAHELLEGAMVRQFRRRGASSRQPPTVLLLHGILGSRRNMQSFARRLLAGFPSWQVLLVDLRCHGESACSLPPPPPSHSTSISGGRVSSGGGSSPGHGREHELQEEAAAAQHAQQHSVAAAAADVLSLLGALRLFPDVLVGHSFGGKVVLEMWEQFGRAARQMPKPVKVWVLDAVPGPDPAGAGGGGPSAATGGSSSLSNTTAASFGTTATSCSSDGSSSSSSSAARAGTSAGSDRRSAITSSSGGFPGLGPEALIAAMRDAPLPAPSRFEVVRHLERCGFCASTAAWAATNLAPDGAGGLVWGVDLECIAQMYSSFKASSHWHVLERQVEGFSLGFVRAEHSAFDWEGSGTERRIREMGHSVHLLPNSSHLVHAENEGNPAGLFDILAPSLGSAPDSHMQCPMAWGLRQGQGPLRGSPGAVPPPAPQLEPPYAVCRTNNAF